MSKDYRHKLLNMFEKMAKEENHTPSLGNHPNYVQSFDGKLNKQLKQKKQGGYGSGYDYPNIYGNGSSGGCMSCGAGCPCCDMSSGKGYSGGSSELPPVKEDYYGSLNKPTRSRLLKSMEKSAKQLRTGGQIPAAQPEYAKSMQTPPLNELQCDQYRNLEQYRFKDALNSNTAEQMSKKYNILENEKLKEVDVPPQKLEGNGRKKNKAPLLHESPKISEKYLSPQTSKNVQEVKVHNDAVFDRTHGRGYGMGTSGGKRMKNANRSAASKKAAEKNPWIEHVKMMAKKMNLSYKDAISNKKVKQSYRK